MSNSYHRANSVLHLPIALLNTSSGEPERSAISATLLPGADSTTTFVKGIHHAVASSGERSKMLRSDSQPLLHRGITGGMSVLGSSTDSNNTKARHGLETKGFTAQLAKLLKPFKTASITELARSTEAASSPSAQRSCDDAKSHVLPQPHTTGPSQAGSRKQPRDTKEKYDHVFDHCLSSANSSTLRINTNVLPSRMNRQQWCLQDYIMCQEVYRSKVCTVSKVST